MNNNEYTTIGLYDHNADSYNQVKSSFESGQDVVAIVHATGTGKSYNALQLAYDNKDKKIVYVVPSHGIIEHINKIIDDNPNLDLKRDFPNLEFRTYQSFISLSEDEISDINCDLLILDEFHHIGAPIWGARINTMIETHPDMKIFGMTAYTVRDRGTSYERDMANPDTDELFSGKVESRYDLCDAMIDGVLPKPVYKSAYTNLNGLESQLEKKVQKLGSTSNEYQLYMKILNDVKKRIHEAPSIPNILKKSIKPDGKYIYFCPPCSEDGSNDIETIKQQAIEWFKQFVPEKDIIFYTSTSDMGEDGKKNREAFYRDINLDGDKVDNKLRIMFAINQYNEGIHAPNIDGVIMGRGTTSDIVYFEQLGRALSVRGSTKDKFDELEQLSIDELISMCKEKEIPINDNSSKEELIEKLIAPVVIDLTNNYEFIKDLENNLRDRIKVIQENGLGNHREMKIRDASFDIEIENQDLFEMLRYVMDRMTMTWEDKYELAKAYYEHHGNLEVPYSFKTVNGYEYNENGIKLGIWISTQKIAYKGKGTYKISEEQIKLLESIGMIFDDLNEKKWLERYNLAKAYYEHHGNLEVPQSFKTINGYEYNDNGIKLGNWINTQRNAYKGKGSYKISEEQIKLLESIGMIFDDLNEKKWLEKYNLAKAYYEHHGNLEVPQRFKTINGYEYNENGIKLGNWINTQRRSYKGKENYKISEEHIKLLESIGMIFDDLNEKKWLERYNLAKAYYEHHGNLEVPQRFKTINGYEYNENGIKLGNWISNQKSAYKGNISFKISEEQIKLLESIGMIFDDLNEKKWLERYNLAKAYYEHHGNLEVPQRFKTINGYEYNENGIKLGIWISKQKSTYKGKENYKISDELIKLLEDIGINWFSDSIKEKLQQEQITKENLKRKKIEIQNRFNSVLNNHEIKSLPSNDVLNEDFLNHLNSNKKL